MIDTTSMGIMANMVQPTTSTMASHMISQKDSDSDSNLTLEELGVSKETFSSYDTDSDGLVSKSELTTAIDTAMSQFDGDMPSQEEFQSILSDFGFEAPSNFSKSSSGLSNSQLETISSVLENYDSSNLSQSDAQVIVQAFQAAGIESGKELETAMEEAGFSAQEVGTLAGVGASVGGIPQGGAPSGGGGGGGGSSSETEETYDVMDTNEDGVVSAEEIAEYYGTNDTTETLLSNQQKALDNLQLLMETLKANSEDGTIDESSFEGLLKVINNQNNNGAINNYLEGQYRTSTMFGYA